MQKKSAITGRGVRSSRSLESGSRNGRRVPGVADRVELVLGDMFRDPLPTDCDVVLLSNILHDWDVPECKTLVRRCTEVLPSGGRLLIHDIFLNDELDGPLPGIALYSAALSFYRRASLQCGRISPVAQRRRINGEQRGPDTRSLRRFDGHESVGHAFQPVG